MASPFADLVSEIRYAFRQIRASRGASFVAVLTLALGIGANTAIFSVVSSLLLEPLPYPQPDRLVSVFELNTGGGWNSVSGGAYKDWVEQSQSFESLAIFEQAQRNLSGVDRPERIEALAVSAGFLPTLGVEPALGRGFAPGEDRVGGDAGVVVLSDRFWQARFGGRESVLGETLTLDGVAHSVIGVLPPRALLQDEAEILVPTVIDLRPEHWTRSGHWRSVIGRLAPRVDVAAAQADLRGIKQRLASEYPEFKEDWSVAVVPVAEVYAEASGSLLPILSATVLLVLLIACANVSGLLLARGQARVREMAIRSALGAHRWRIVRQLLVESMVLSLLGCALGLLLGQYGIELLGQLALAEIPAPMRPELDPTVLVFSLCLALASGVLFGMLPAWMAVHRGTSDQLKETQRGATSVAKRRAQVVLVVGELALTFVLLVAAGLLLRSFGALLDTDPGFEPAETVAFDLTLASNLYPEHEDRLAFLDEARGRLRALPGVESVGSAFALPLSGRGRTEMASRADGPPDPSYSVATNFVDPSYFETIGMRLVAGRGFVEADNRLPPARRLVVDTRLATELYPGEDPLGQPLRFLGESWEIVGVVAPVRHFLLDREPLPSVYAAQAHAPGPASFVLRTALPPSSLVASIRAAIEAVDPAQPVANLRTLDRSIYDSLARRRTVLGLLGTFAAVAIGLACLGVYGLMAFAAGQRARELGIRSALGARRRDLLRMILSSGLRTTLAGIGLGLLAAAAAAGLIESLLFEVDARDPVVYLAAALVLAAVSALAIYLPARRAAEADPIHVLRR